MQNIIHSKKAIKICSQKLGKIRLEDRRYCSHAKLLLRRLTYASIKNVCKSIDGIDVSQFYPYSMCQRMAAGLYTRYEFDADLQKHKPHHNKTKSFESRVMSYFQRMIPACRIDSFHKTGTQKIIDWFNADGFCGHCNTVLEAMCC